MHLCAVLCPDLKNMFLKKFTEPLLRSLRSNGHFWISSIFDKFSLFWFSRLFDLGDLGNLRRGSVHSNKKYEVCHNFLVENFNSSSLEAHAGFFRLLMKGLFAPYVL
jgi:hypothetical protein